MFAADCVLSLSAPLRPAWTRRTRETNHTEKDVLFPYEFYSRRGVEGRTGRSFPLGRESRLRGFSKCGSSLPGAREPYELSALGQQHRRPYIQTRPPALMIRPNI